MDASRHVPPMRVFPQLLLADGRFPVGGHAHSGGLEAAVAGGLEAGHVPAFIAGRLHGSTAPEAHLAVTTRRAAARGDLDLLQLLAEEAEARCAAPPLREAARRLGAQLVRTARAVFGEDRLLDRWPAPEAPVPRPVAFGAVAAVAGLDDAGCARAYLYDDAVTVATAAVRLLPLDPATAFGWIARLENEIEDLAAQAAAADAAPRDLPAPFAPLIDLGSLAHARMERSLFAS